MSSQRAKRKLQMPLDSQELKNTGLMPNQNDAEVEDAGHEPIEVLLRMFQKLSVISGRRALVKMNQIVDAINTSQANELRNFTEGFNVIRTKRKSKGPLIFRIPKQ